MRAFTGQEFGHVGKLYQEPPLELGELCHRITGLSLQEMRNKVLNFGNDEVDVGNVDVFIADILETYLLEGLRVLRGDRTFVFAAELDDRLEESTMAMCHHHKLLGVQQWGNDIAILGSHNLEPITPLRNKV